ncbi:hypothetical protein KFL_009490050 [Klebsormidium nitens]|uniref:Uncharacterized protein n=1 Tax=Klebsormidium nitens TaxID=105231 RepID=A0A1Y1IQA0_KLENI|nr:hypothetical protein KFL_009490050 [Klebsormidium nitens]|eukprot:GAQ92222.1 hypothetical protein KFL_009490050 [Klebsormidium nitens]
MVAKSSLIGLFGLLCLVLHSAKVFAVALKEDSGSVVLVTEPRFRGESIAVAHRKLMQTASPATQAPGAVASMCAPTDRSLNPLTRVYCSYNVTIGGAPVKTLTVCTYNATGALLAVPAATISGGAPRIPPFSCPGNVVPNSCPASIQRNFANASIFYQQYLCVYAVNASTAASTLCGYVATGASNGMTPPNCPSAPTPICPVINVTSNPLTRLACLYGVQQSVPSVRTVYADCFYNTTGALQPLVSRVDDPNIVSCPGAVTPTCPTIDSNPLTRLACLYSVQQSVPPFTAMLASCFYNTTGDWLLPLEPVDTPNICPSSTTVPNPCPGVVSLGLPLAVSVSSFKCLYTTPAVVAGSLKEEVARTRQVADCSAASMSDVLVDNSPYATEGRLP